MDMKQQPDRRWPGTGEIEHPFYGMLDRVLDQAGFHAFVDKLGGEVANPLGVRPRVYFRMLLVGYFENIDCLRGIVWRCRDSRSVQEFLGCLPGEPAPDHILLAATARRLSAEVHEEVFAFVLKRVREEKLFHVQTLMAADINYREANAAMKSIQRQDALDDYQPFLLRLAQDAAIENPSEEFVCAKNGFPDRDPGDRAPASNHAHLGDKINHVVDLDMCTLAYPKPWQAIIDMPGLDVVNGHTARYSRPEHNTIRRRYWHSGIIFDPFGTLKIRWSFAAIAAGSMGLLFFLMGAPAIPQGIWGLFVVGLYTFLGLRLGMILAGFDLD
jgi:hypothetical protein